MTQVNQTHADSAQILDLGQRLAERAFSQADALETYWDGLRHGQDIPLRRDVDPRAIQDLLEYAFIAEEIAPGMARLRIAGAHLSDLSGMEVRGMPLASMVAVEARDGLRAALDALFARPAKIDLRLASQDGVTGRLVMLPLRCEEGRTTRALGCLVTRGRPGRLPCRLSIIDSHVTPVAQSPRPQLRAVTPAEPAPQKRPPVGGRPYLRLVTQTD